MRIPFFTFRKNLVQRYFDKNITLNVVDAWHASKLCNHCGAVGKGHGSGNYALFRCKECGAVVNSDRHASLNIAIKPLLERRGHKPNQSDFVQISNRRVTINGPIWHSDGVAGSSATVPHNPKLMNVTGLAERQFT